MVKNVAQLNYLRPRNLKIAGLCILAMHCIHFQTFCKVSIITSFLLFMLCIFAFQIFSHIAFFGILMPPTLMCSKRSGRAC